jgi:hypothetical protein
MSDLGTALRELARETEPAEVDAGDLWQRGRRRVRRQRVVLGSAAVVLAVLTGFVALAAPSRTVVMPAVAPHAPAVPENVYLPDPHLAGTAEEGPLGRLAVLGSAERAYGDSSFSPSAFGVSASTGTYRFLDLPGQVLGTPVALSPDGRHLAYWTSGPTTGTPYDDEVPSGSPAHTGGFAIYDTEDGSVARAPLASEHGLSETIPFWVDSTTVAFEVWQKTTRTAARKVNTYLWTGSGTPRVTTRNVRDVSALQRNRDGSLLAPRPSGDYDAVTVVPDGFRHTPGDRVVFADTVEAGRSGYDAVSRSGRLVAAVPYDLGDTSRPLMVGRLDGAGVVARLIRIVPVWTVSLLGWRDARTVLVAGIESGSDAALYTADLRSGDLRRIGKVDPGLLASDNHLVVASDLVAAPLVHGRRPPTPPDRPWSWLALAGGGCAAGVGLAAWLWRRRRAQG